MVVVDSSELKQRKAHHTDSGSNKARPYAQIVYRDHGFGASGKGIEEENL